MCSSPNVRPVRTAADPPLGPKEALRLLKALGCSRASFLTITIIAALPALPAGRQQALRGRTPAGQPHEFSDPPGAGGEGPGPARGDRWLRRLSRAPGDYLRHDARRVMHQSCLQCTCL